jgi:hypothetical protein
MMGSCFLEGGGWELTGDLRWDKLDANIHFDL